MAVINSNNAQLTFSNLPVGIQVTRVTDTSADWPSVANSTYFYDKGDGLVHYKNSGGTVLELFSAGGLTYFTEAQSTASPNATVNVDSLTAISATTNADVAIRPKGTGAILAAIPDNAITGGNKRGDYSVDLQLSRSAANQVVSGTYSFAAGSNNRVDAAYATASGQGCIVTNNWATAIGRANTASGDSSVALGFNSTASNNRSIAIGESCNATGISTIAIGASNTSNISYATAIGYLNTASGSAAVAIGQSNTISGNYGVGIGNLNTATDYSTALGKSNTVSSTLSGAMGNGNTHAAGASYSFSVGRDNIISAAATNSFVAGYNNTVSADRSFAIGSGNTSSGGNAIALGINATASGAQSFAALNRAKATGASSFAIGGYVYVDTTASGDNSVAIGAANTASAMFGTAVGGYGNIASGIASYANGNQANTFSIAGRQSRGYINTVSGDCQKSEFYLSVRTTGNTASTATVNGGAASTSNQVILSNQSAYRFKGTIIGKQSGSVNAAVWDIDGFIVRGANAAATTLNVSNVNLVQNTPAWGTPTLAADTTNGGLQVQVTGATATNIQWTAVIETTEVIYA